MLTWRYGVCIWDAPEAPRVQFRSRIRKVGTNCPISLSRVDKYLTMANHYIFHRPEFAAELTRRMLVISGQELSLSESPLTYGAFLTGLRGIGKTTFLTKDLVPALEDAGAIVIYVPLEEDGIVNPEKKVLRFIREALESLKSKSETYFSLAARFAKSAAWRMGGLELGFDTARVEEEDGVSLDEAFLEVVEKANTDVVLIVDEVQELSKSPKGNGLLWSFKSARDTINTIRGRKGNFVFVGAGSHPAMIHEMMTNGSAAFRGAKEVPYPLLGSDYVEFALKVFERRGATKLPSLTAAVRAFEVMHHEPNELFEAFTDLQKTSSSETLDESFMKIAECRAGENALSQVERVVKMGPLASAIFTRISSDGGELRNPVSRSAVVEYSKLLGREVQAAEALSTRQELAAANLIVRKAGTCYRISNPLVRKLWREEQEAEE